MEIWVDPDQVNRSGLSQGGFDAFGVRVIGNGPTDRFLRKTINHGGGLHESLPRVNLVSVAEGLHAGVVGGEDTLRD